MEDCFDTIQTCLYVYAMYVSLKHICRFVTLTVPTHVHFGLKQIQSTTHVHFFGNLETIYINYFIYVFPQTFF